MRGRGKVASEGEREEDEKRLPAQRTSAEEAKSGGDVRGAGRAFSKAITTNFAKSDDIMAEMCQAQNFIAGVDRMAGEKVDMEGVELT